MQTETEPDTIRDYSAMAASMRDAGVTLAELITAALEALAADAIAGKVEWSRYVVVHEALMTAFENTGDT